MCIRDSINWAGYEEKKPETVNHYGTEKIMISPRKSFEIFSEDINGKSKHWQNKNIIAVEKLIPVILETSINQSSKIVELNDQLKKLNEELDSFSHTISHDLGTPLTVMKLNAQLLERTQKENPDVQKKVKKIIEEINSMEVMMRNVLDLSRAKTSEIHLENMETLSLIDKIMYDAKSVSYTHLDVYKRQPEKHPTHGGGGLCLGGDSIFLGRKTALCLERRYGSGA